MVGQLGKQNKTQNDYFIFLAGLNHWSWGSNYFNLLLVIG